MSRSLAFAAGCTLVLLFFAATSAPAAQFGTEAEARALLDRAVAAVKNNKAKALDMFNKGEGGFRDRDLYVSCANSSDGTITAHPYRKGEHLQNIKGKKGFPLGQEIMRTATEGRSARLPIGGLAPVLTCRSRSTLFSQRPEIKTAGSATISEWRMRYRRDVLRNHATTSTMPIIPLSS
jgi:hypothetical protein